MLTAAEIIVDGTSGFQIDPYHQVRAPMLDITSLCILCDLALNQKAQFWAFENAVLLDTTERDASKPP